MSKWTFTSNSDGYTIFCDGEFYSGAIRDPRLPHGYNSDGRRRAWQHIRADAQMNRETAQRICDEKNRQER